MKNIESVLCLDVRMPKIADQIFFPEENKPLFMEFNKQMKKL